ncbi:MAG: TIGR04013 family B12-binding domain/radical SAM domain-containing protein [Thermoprotei archaeon]
MKQDAIVIGYWKTIKYSVHVLLGAAEKHGLYRDIDFYLVPVNNVLDTINRLRSKYSKLMYMQTLLTTDLLSTHEKLTEINRRLRDLGFVSIAGGPHATGDPFGTVISLGFTYAFLGEVEDLLPQVIELGLGYRDPSSTAGIFYVDSDKFMFRGRGLTEKLDEYPPFSPRHGLFNPIEITRGCQHSCSFCQVSYMHTARTRHRSVESVKFWCKYLLDKGIRDLRFITPDALSYEDPESNRDFVELLTELNTLRSAGGRVYFGTFPSETRPEEINQEVARFLRTHVDNKRVNIGAQSGSNELLKKIRRGHTSEDVLNALEALSSAGLTAEVDYIIGLPDETPEDQKLTIEHVRKVISMGGRVRIHYFMPLPGTPYALRKPSGIPLWLRHELMRLVGCGKARGNWLNQEKVVKELLRLRDEGVILLTSSRARNALSNSLRKT